MLERPRFLTLVDCRIVAQLDLKHCFSVGARASVRISGTCPRPTRQLAYVNREALYGAVAVTWRQREVATAIELCRQ